MLWQRGITKRSKSCVLWYCCTSWHKARQEQEQQRLNSEADFLKSQCEPEGSLCSVHYQRVINLDQIWHHTHVRRLQVSYPIFFSHSSWDYRKLGRNAPEALTETKPGASSVWCTLVLSDTLTRPVWHESPWHDATFSIPSHLQPEFMWGEICSINRQDC